MHKNLIGNDPFVLFVILSLSLPSFISKEGVDLNKREQFKPVKFESSTRILYVNTR